MDIDLSVLRSLENEKDISSETALKAIEDALLMVLVGAAAGAALWISPLRVFRPR